MDLGPLLLCVLFFGPILFLFWLHQWCEETDRQGWADLIAFGGLALLIASVLISGCTAGTDSNSDVIDQYLPNEPER